MLAHIIATAIALQGSVTRPVADCWIGTVGAGRSMRQAVLELGPEGAGAITVLQRTAERKQLIDVVDSATSLAFTIAGTTTRFTGRRAADGASITGAITQAPAEPSRPVLLRRLTADDSAARLLVGFWAGQVEANGLPARVILKFRAASCGATHLLMDSPDQAATNLPATDVRVRGDSIHAAMEFLGAEIDGVVDRRRGRITGTWTQAGRTMALSLTRVDSSLANRRPQDPIPPLPYRSEDVRFENAGVRLAGTLTIPTTPGPHPAILLLSGSGAQDRDETVAGHRPFLILADALTRAGIAVLRVDDRGIGGSTGSVMQATLADNAADATAALRLLTSRPEVDSLRLGLLGHSEGGWLAPVVAGLEPMVRFVVLLAGPALPGDTLLYAQQRALSLAAGDPPEVIMARRNATAMIARILREEPVDSIAARRVDSAMTAMRESATGRLRVVIDSLYGPARAAEMRSSWTVMVSPWFRHLVAHDPAPYLRTLHVPVLALYGARDLQVPAAVNASALRDALGAAHNPDVTIMTLPELNHLFQHAVTGLPDEYARIEETIAPEVTRTIVEWVALRAGVKATHGGSQR